MRVSNGRQRWRKSHFWGVTTTTREWTKTITFLIRAQTETSHGSAGPEMKLNENGREDEKEEREWEEHRVSRRKKKRKLEVK